VTVAVRVRVISTVGVLVMVGVVLRLVGEAVGSATVTEKSFCVLQP
jgi:hypothetical protein